jgi:hypothetical protein
MRFEPPKFLVNHPLWQRLRGRASGPAQSDADTVMAWPPRPARLLSGDERLVHPALEGALHVQHPQGFVFAHVPLSRLVRVPARRSHKDWLARTAHVSADFVLCDASSRPLVVVMLTRETDSDGRQRRRERVLRICEAAGIRLLEWPAGWKPEPRTLRELLFSSAGPAQTPGH